MSMGHSWISWVFFCLSFFFILIFVFFPGIQSVSSNKMEMCCYYGITWWKGQLSTNLQTAALFIIIIIIINYIWNRKWNLHYDCWIKLLPWRVVSCFLKRFFCYFIPSERNILNMYTVNLRQESTCFI